jgi:hypothetical protein
MRRFIRILLWTMLIVPLVGLVTAAAGLAVARATLPASACVVSEASVETLRIEKMTGADVAERLGCDGVHNVTFDSKEVRMETVTWRGDAWPYAFFEATLINDVLHGTRKVWLNLDVTLPKG